MIIDQKILDDLTDQAKASPRLRMNLDLRNSPTDNSQRMLNAIEPGTVLPIHRHRTTSETVVCLRGHFVEYFYDDSGTRTAAIDMTPGGTLINIPAGQWHNLVSLESGTVLLEVKDGAYEPVGPEDMQERDDKTERVEIIECFDPLLCEDPKVLILGTLPGVESLEHREYYYSNSNRIWKVLCQLTGEQMPLNYGQKKVLLSVYHLALWDYYASAVRLGSKDSAIRDARPNDIRAFLAEHPTIDTIAINGFGKYERFGKRLKKELAVAFPDRAIRVLPLPDTSGENCNYGWGDLDALAGAWSVIFE